MREEWLEDDCPCGSGELYAQCCDVFICGAASAPTAEKLMRSRYSAFVVEEPQYVYETHDPSTREELDIEEVRAWSAQSVWEGLNVIAVEGGEEGDDEGVVEFVAHYTVGEKTQHHHERSTFKKKAGQWYFIDGAMINNTYRRDTPKVGRNDPCPCGSGKKFKKCCGK